MYGIGRIANSSFDTKRKSYICVVYCQEPPLPPPIRTPMNEVHLYLYLWNFYKYRLVISINFTMWRHFCLTLTLLYDFLLSWGRHGLRRRTIDLEAGSEAGFLFAFVLAKFVPRHWTDLLLFWLLRYFEFGKQCWLKTNWSTNMLLKSIMTEF